MTVNPANKWEELAKELEKRLNNWETKFPNQTPEEVLKSQAKTKKELEQAKVQLENQKDYDTTKNERDWLQQQAEQKTQQFQLIAKELGLTEQATPEQIKEKLNKLGVPAEDKSTVKNYLNEYKNLLEQLVEECEDLKKKDGENEENHQSEQDDFTAQIEQVEKFIVKWDK